QSLNVPRKIQHKVLFYGVFGALAMRILFIVAGVQFLERFHPVLFLFAGILVVTGVRMLMPGTRTLQPDRIWLVRLVRRVLPIKDSFSGDRFFVKQQQKWNATPLFLALIAVEVMDIIFAIDSVPAVLSITRDTFIVYSSNAFAILGLRALYFVLADMLWRL